MSIRGHFDGKVVVLDEPASLRLNQRVNIMPEPEPATQAFGSLAYILSRQTYPLADEDAAEMISAIEQACEHVDADSDFQL